MATRQIYIDESKRTGYILAAVTVADPAVMRKVIRDLLLPGQRRIHMKHEQPRRRRAIIAALEGTSASATIYDAGRRYSTDRAARVACLGALVEDVANTGDAVQLIIEQDESLVQSDRHELYRLVWQSGVSGLVEYRHRALTTNCCWHSQTCQHGAGPALATGDGGSRRCLLTSAISGSKKRKARAPRPSGRVSGSLPAASALGNTHPTR